MANATINLNKKIIRHIQNIGRPVTPTQVEELDFYSSLLELLPFFSSYQKDFPIPQLASEIEILRPLAKEFGFIISERANSQLYLSWAN